MAKKILLWLAATYFLIAMVGRCTPRDTTDDPAGDRSGMALRIDHMTGCHYLAEPFGGITPRLDASGQHICGGRHD